MFFGQFAIATIFVLARNSILVFLRWFVSFGNFSKRLLCDLLNRPSPMPKPWNESCWDLHSAPIRHWSRIWNRLDAFRDIFREHGTRNVNHATVSGVCPDKNLRYGWYCSRSLFWEFHLGFGVPNHFQVSKNTISEHFLVKCMVIRRILTSIECFSVWSQLSSPEPS